MRASADNRYGEPLGAGSYPLSRFWGTAGPAVVAGGCSRGPERRGWHASRWGKPLTPDGPWRHWLLVQVTEDLSAQVTEGLAVPGPVRCPGHLLVPPNGRCGGFWSVGSALSGRAAAG